MCTRREKEFQREVCTLSMAEIWFAQPTRLALLGLTAPLSFPCLSPSLPAKGVWNPCVAHRPLQHHWCTKAFPRKRVDSHPVCCKPFVAMSGRKFAGLEVLHRKNKPDRSSPPSSPSIGPRHRSWTRSPPPMIAGPWTFGVWRSRTQSQEPKPVHENYPEFSLASVSLSRRFERDCKHRACRLDMDVQSKLGET